MKIEKGFSGESSPVLFRILNIDLNIYTHCGVIDFTAEEETCYLPTNMFNRLFLQEGQTVNLRNIKLEQGKFIKIQPHLTAFINNPNPKTILENQLRNYFCLTKGDTITVYFNKKSYDIDIIECKPKDAISTTNCDIEVDFETPKDYVEPQESSSQFGKQSSSVKFNEEKIKKKLSEEEIKKKIEDDKFSGHHVRIDGKKITENQVKKIEKEKLKQEAEENYDPRLNRIQSRTRCRFHGVQI